jgi:rSAM/selenodomain-associated transferase 1
MGPMPRGAIVVFAKRPAPGQVKTRLCPPFTPEQAAQLYAEMLADVLELTAAQARRLCLEPVLAAWPPDAGRDLVRDAPPGFRVVAQRGPDLAGRMARAVDEQQAAGFSRVLLRGSDSPALDAAAFDEALAALDEHDLVLCPDLDGGYNLVGLSRPAPGLFDHPMSTRSVLDDTCANARRLGLRVRVLAPRFDVDTASDLVRLARIRAEGRGAGCRRTFAWLDARRLWPGPA